MSVNISWICWKFDTGVPKAVRSRAHSTASSIAAWASPSAVAHANTRPYSKKLNNWGKPFAGPCKRHDSSSSTLSNRIWANGSISWPILLSGTASTPFAVRGTIHMDNAGCPFSAGASSSIAATSRAGAYSPLFTNIFSPFMNKRPSTDRTDVFMPVVSEPEFGSETAKANARRPVF